MRQLRLGAPARLRDTTAAQAGRRLAGPRFGRCVTHPAGIDLPNIWLDRGQGETLGCRQG
jgi:hypothetical protein